MKLGKLLIPASLIAIFLLSFASFGADDRQKAATISEIEDNLIAPCCWSQPVSQHYSEVSEQIRKEVRTMVESGKSRDEIMNHFVAKYGERILATPPPKGFNALAYILPWGSLILGACFLIVLLKKLRSQASAAEASTLPPPDAHYYSVIEKEIKELEE